MKSAALLAACVALAWGVSADALAKGRLRAHSSSHSSGSSPHAHAGEAHGGEGVGSGLVRSAIARARDSDNGSPAAIEETPEVRQQREAAQTKAAVEALAARKLEYAAAEEKRRQLAEQAAIAAAEEQKRRDAETRARDREQAALERQREQIAWENRCQIKAVMTDLEIATCREVWTSPLR